MMKDKKTSVFKCMRYTFKMLYAGDRKIAFFSFYKQITELIVDSLLSVYLLRKLFEYIENGIDYIELVKMVGIICGLHVIVHINSAFHAYYVRLKKPVIYQSMYRKIIDKASEIELVRYEQPDFYDRFSKSLDECLDKAVDSLIYLTWAVGAFTAVITSSIIIAQVDPVILLFILPPVAVSLMFGVLQNRTELELRKSVTKDKRVTEYVKRVFFEKKYASEIRLYNIKNLLYSKQDEGFKNRTDLNIKYRKRMALYNILSFAVSFVVSSLGCYIYVAYKVKLSQVPSMGAYVAVVSTIGFVTGEAIWGIRCFVNSGNSCIYMQNMKDFLEYESENRHNGFMKIDGHVGDIVFDDVCFTYEGAAEPVINHLNLHVKKGEKIALVGENGAGKTTLIKLLMGLYPVTEGSVKVDGNDVENLERQDYHNHIGTVFQDFQIFSLSLAENVLMREPQTDEERELIKESLIKAQFGDVLDTLESGIDTMITKEFDENGFVCSGGQAQKIAIARVFAKNPDLVILDEPSSALDPIAEYNMYNNMMQLTQGKTVFFISHRLSSARLADKIYFLEKGHIVEAGTHDELMKLKGKYAQMFVFQAKNYREDQLFGMNIGSDNMEVGL